MRILYVITALIILAEAALGMCSFEASIAFTLVFILMEIPREKR